MVNTITMLAEQIQELDNMRLGMTGRACEQNSIITAKKQQLQEDLRAFLEHERTLEKTIKNQELDRQNRQNRQDRQELDRTEEEQAAFKASQRLFEIYCETILQAEAFQADPEAYLEEMSDETGEVFTIDAVLDMADDDIDYAEQVLILARKLWSISVCGMKMV